MTDSTREIQEFLDEVGLCENRAEDALSRRDMNCFHYWARLYHETIAGDRKPLGWIEP